MPNKRNKRNYSRDSAHQRDSAAQREIFDRTMRWLAPLPRLDSRWQAVCQAADGLPVPADVVAFIDVEAVAYLKLLSICTTDAERAAVRARWPAISQALDIFKANGPQRWEVEARVLSGQTDDEIATHCGLTSDVVAVYKNYFFSVGSEYLEHPDWLEKKIFGLWPPTFGIDQVDRFWAWLALAGGPAILDSFVKAFHAEWRVGTPATLIAYLRPDAAVSLAIQAVVAIKVLPKSVNTAEIFFQTHLGLIEAHRDPVRTEEKLDQLKRKMVAYTFALLNRASARQLKRLLYGPEKRKSPGEQPPTPPVLFDPLSLLPSLLSGACKRT